MKLIEGFNLAGSVIGIWAFVRTLLKRGRGEFTFRTQFGDEINPFLVVIRGEIYNVQLTVPTEHFWALKLPSTLVLSNYKYKEHEQNELDESTFFPLLGQGSVLCIPKAMEAKDGFKIYYEDMFGNCYYQTFKFSIRERDRKDRIQVKSRSCYVLSRRYQRVLGIWIPKFM